MFFFWVSAVFVGKKSHPNRLSKPVIFVESNTPKWNWKVIIAATRGKSSTTRRIQNPLSWFQIKRTKVTPREKQSCLEDVDSIYISCCQPLCYLKNVKGAKAHFFVRFIGSYVQSVKRLLLTSAIISPCWHLTTTLLPTIPRWAKGPNCAYFKDVLALLCRRHGIPHLLQNSKDLPVGRSQVPLQVGFVSDVHLGPWHWMAHFGSNWIKH